VHCVCYAAIMGVSVPRDKTTSTIYTSLFTRKAAATSERSTKQTTWRMWPSSCQSPTSATMDVSNKCNGAWHACHSFSLCDACLSVCLSVTLVVKRVQVAKHDPFVKNTSRTRLSINTAQDVQCWACWLHVNDKYRWTVKYANNYFCLASQRCDIK